MPIVPIKSGRNSEPRKSDPDIEPSPKTYEVGYGKPPKHSRFRKGQSGNPNGRPKWAKGLNTIIREEMLARIPVRTRTGERLIPRAQAMVLKLLELAGKGDMRALRLLLDLYGSAVPDAPESSEPTDVVDFSGADKAILDALRADLLGAESGQRSSPSE